MVQYPWGGVNVRAIVSRVDRSSPEALVNSLEMEIARVTDGYTAMLARVTAIESLHSVDNRLLVDDDTVESAELPKSVLIDAAHSLSGAAGFHALEHDETGAPFRWTGPDPSFAFDFFIDRTHGAHFTLRFIRLYCGSDPSSLRCFVDGTETPLTFTVTLKGVEAAGAIRPRTAAGATIVSFLCSAMSSPAELEATDDDRSLGLAFKSLNVDALSAPAAAAPAALAVVPVESAPTPVRAAAKNSPTAVKRHSKKKR